MKEQIEQQFNIKLDKFSFTENKNIYADYVYFYKKEIKQDHYFTNKDKLYVLEYNIDNYNPSITETGKSDDSFKFHIKKCKEIKQLLTGRNEIKFFSDKDGILPKKEINMLEVIKEIEDRLEIIKNKLKE